MSDNAPDRHINMDKKIEDNDAYKRQPHERDESPDGQATGVTGIGKQAASDLANGLVDTDLRVTPGLPPEAGGSGQAQPQPDRTDAMRDQDVVPKEKGNPA